jgi:hypothetical protein
MLGRCFAAAAALLVHAPGALAQDGGGSGVGLRVGSGGIVLDYAHALGTRFDLRGGFALGKVGREIEEDGIDYDADVEFASVLGMLDYRPFAGGFRISAGAYSRAPEVALLTRGEDEQYQIGNNEYTASGRLDGDIDFGAVTPYLGIGWGGTTGGAGFGWSADVGVMIADAPSVELVANGRACSSTLLACDPDGPFGFDVNDPDDPRARAFRSELEREEDNVEAEIEDLRYWPVVSLGLHYRF